MKQYFDNKKGNNQIDKINSDNVFNSINNIINKSKNSQVIKEESNNNKKVVYESIKIENNLKNQRLGLRKSVNINYNSTIKLSKSFKSNLTLKDNKNALQASYKAIDEVEEEKDVPWIREEDC